MADQKTEGLDVKLKYIDPFTRDYRDYFDHIIAYNRTFQAAVKRDLQNIQDSREGKHVFMAAGSDARLEKGPGSTIEVVTLGANPLAAREGTSALVDYISQQDRDHLFDPSLEVRHSSDKSSEWILRRGQPDERKVVSIPRVFDSVILDGDFALFKSFKDGLVTELTGAEGKKILEATENKSREYRKVVPTGKQPYRGVELKHYDLESGVANYNPAENIWAFKQGPLRAVQFTLARDQARAIRSGIEPQIFFEAPTNTIERLNALEVQDLLGTSSEQTKDLCDHYKYFLRLYHLSQENYRKGLYVTGFDVRETKARVEELDKILSSGHLVKKKEN